MTDANIAMAFVIGFAVHCVMVYAVVKLVVTKKPLLSDHLRRADEMGEVRGAQS